MLKYECHGLVKCRTLKGRFRQKHDFLREKIESTKILRCYDNPMCISRQRRQTPVPGNRSLAGLIPARALTFLSNWEKLRFASNSPRFSTKRDANLAAVNIFSRIIRFSKGNRIQYRIKFHSLERARM